MTDRTRALTAAEVLELPAMASMQQAAAAVGVSREVGYELAARGEFPVPVIRIGRSLKVTRQSLLGLLGIQGAELEDQRAAESADRFRAVVADCLGRAHENPGDDTLIAELRTHFGRTGPEPAGSA